MIKRLVYDGNNVQLETDDVGDLLVDNTYVPNKYGMALSQRRDGDSSFYLADGTQDVRQLTDSVQSVTDEYEFDAWGNSLSSTGGTSNAQQYKGQQLAYRADPDAGPELQYALHFRQYDPHTARFTSRDPAEDDLNLYRYVKNNPVNEVDPSGLGELDDPTEDKLFGEIDERKAFWSALDSPPTGLDGPGRFAWEMAKGMLAIGVHALDRSIDPGNKTNHDKAFALSYAGNTSLVQDAPPSPADPVTQLQKLAREKAVEASEQAAISGEKATPLLDTALPLAVSAVGDAAAAAVPAVKKVTNAVLKRVTGVADDLIPSAPAARPPVTNDPVTAKLRLEAKANELRNIESAASKTLERVQETTTVRPPNTAQAEPTLSTGANSPKASSNIPLETKIGDSSSVAPISGAKLPTPINNGIPANVKILHTQEISFSGPDWRTAGKDLNQKFPGKSIVYVLKDAKTSEVLKVGVDKIDSLPDVWRRYKNAQDVVPHRHVTMDVSVVETAGITVQSVEKQVHQAFTEHKHKLPWDNDYPKGRLERPGPGVPGVYDSRRAKAGYRWVQEQPGTDPVYKKVDE